MKMPKDLILKTPEDIFEMLKITRNRSEENFNHVENMRVENMEPLYACNEKRLLLYKGFGRAMLVQFQNLKIQDIVCLVAKK